MLKQLTTFVITQISTTTVTPLSDVQFRFSILFASMKQLQDESIQYNIQVQLLDNIKAECKFNGKGNFTSTQII